MPNSLVPLVSLLLLAACSGAPPTGQRVSLAEALANAQPGATIQLDDGRYDAEHGELWDYEVPDGVTIRGSGKTVLNGSGVALRAQGKLELQQLRFEGFDLVVSLERTARLGLSDVVIDAGTKGVLLDGASSTLVLSGGGVTTSDYAIELGDACTGCSVRIDDAELQGGVFVAEAGATLAISGSLVEGSASNPGINFAGAELDVQASTVRAASGPYGATIRSGVARLDDVTVEGSSYCVYQIAGSTRLRRSSLTGYGSIGLYLASGELDLGTATEAGENSFAGAPESTGAFGIYVDTGTAPVTSSDTSFAGVIPATGTIQAGAEELAEPGQYFLTPGQSISFYRVR